VIKGDSVSEVLRYVEYQPDSMVDAVRRQASAPSARAGSPTISYAR
jgi:arginine decarboxylase-like protein